MFLGFLGSCIRVGFGVDSLHVLGFSGLSIRAFALGAFRVFGFVRYCLEY